MSGRERERTGDGPGVLIANARRSRGLSLRAAAAFLKINPATLSNLETGTRESVGLALLVRIAGKLEIDVDDLAARFGRLAPDLELFLINSPEARFAVRELMARAKP